MWWQDGHTPLHAAALNGRLAVARALLAAGAKDDLLGQARRDGGSPPLLCDGTSFQSRVPASF